MPTIEGRIKAIHDKYINIICPYILQYELLDNTFPIELLNEVRSVFTHLSKVSLAEDSLSKERNLSKAEGHIKRAILDCYKYICMAYDDKYKEFERLYRHVNLSLVDNGEFLPKLNEARKFAIDLMMTARKTDLLIVTDDANIDDSFEKYEAAFIQYSSVYELITSSYKKLENLRKRVVARDYLSYAIGAASIVVSIILFLLSR